MAKGDDIVKMPRITRSILWDQLVWMMVAGLIIGLVFPPFLTLFGVPSQYVLTPLFYTASLSAGLMMGVLNYGLVHFVTRPALQQLSQGMRKVTHALEAQMNAAEAQSKEEVCIRPEDCMVAIRSHDELGEVATAFNHLVTLLRDSRDVQQAYEAFTHQLSTSLELNDLTEKVLKLLGRYHIGDGMALFVQQEGELKPVMTLGIGQVETLIDHPVMDKVVKLKESIRIDLPDNIQVDAMLVRFRPKEIELIPVVYKGILEGILVLARTTSLTPKQQLIRDVFVEGLGLALNNALTHEKIQRIAVLDSLTAIYNRRFGMERLNEEFARAIRQQSPLSIIMADIDHFKSINDRYGHLVGDRAIKTAVQVMKSLLREGDVLIRYGGEEFLILLPGASIDDAMEISEGIRLKMAETPLHVGDSTLQMTLSEGVAGIPEIDVNDPMALIQRADEALYHAKESGRNRVMDARQLAGGPSRATA